MKNTIFKKPKIQKVPIQNIQCHESAEKAYIESMTFNYQFKSLDLTNEFLEHISLFHPLNVVQAKNVYHFFSGWLWLNKLDQKFKTTYVIVHKHKLSTEIIETLSYEYLLMVFYQNFNRQTTLGQFLNTFENISNKSVQQTLFGRIPGKTLRKKISNLSNESREVINHQLKKLK